MARPTLRMDDELLEEIDSRLTYGDSRSEFFREAVKLKMAVDDEMEGLDQEITGESYREFVSEAVREAVEN